MRPRVTAPALLALLLPLTVSAQRTDSVPPTPDCPSCAEWNAPHTPERLFGNVWYVGTHGLAALLVTSSAGHVLLDGGLPESAPRILANVRALGFRVEDVRLIVNSHAHFDHAGGIAMLQRATGATVAAMPASARAMARGTHEPDDPQHGLPGAFPTVTDVRQLRDGETVRVGPLALTAHLTPGHSPGGTTWTWRSCEGARCLDFVFADSQTPVSAPGYSYARSGAVPAFERGLATIEGLSCDVLVTPHPSASRLWERVASGGLADREACRRYAASARQALARRLAEERQGGVRKDGR